MEKLSSLSQQNHNIAGLGPLLIVPALILCFGDILQSFLGATQFNDTLETFELDSFLFNRAVLLGGLFLAVNLDRITVAQLKIQDGSLTGTIQLRGKLPNLALLTGLGLVLGIIFRYILAENIQIFAR